MMPNNRFSFGDGDDSRLVAKASQLKITLMRLEGKVHGCFELSGDLGSSDEEFAGGPATAGDLSFVRDLMERFEGVKD
jgi:hypothetical protein